MSKIRSVLAKVISFASEQPMSYNEAFELLEDRYVQGQDLAGRRG